MTRSTPRMFRRLLPNSQYTKEFNRTTPCHSREACPRMLEAGGGNPGRTNWIPGQARNDNKEYSKYSYL